MVSLKDIALACDVSIASVSKALNNARGVGQQKASQIRKAARDMGYIPNAMARALKTSRSYTIGVLLEDDEHHGLQHQFFASVLESFKACVEICGYDLVFLNRNIGTARISYLEHCRHRNLDGVFTACVDFSQPELQELAAADIPLVSIDHPFKDRAVVYSDNFAGMKMAVRYAAEQGHRKIAYVTGAPSDVTAKRTAGYRETMAALHLPVPGEYLRFSRYRDAKGAFQHTSSLLRLDDPPTCIIMPDDYAAFGGITAIREVGLSIPGAVSVIGYDGLDILDYYAPRLTTVRQDSRLIGRRAGELMLEQIEHGIHALTEKAVMVPVTLIQGETVSAPRFEPRSVHLQIV